MLLGRVHEFGRRDAAPIRCVPARQRLKGDRTPARGFVDRLIVQIEAAVAQRLCQIVRKQAQLIATTVVHEGSPASLRDFRCAADVFETMVEKRRDPELRLLRNIERPVGHQEKLIAGFRMIGRAGDTDAGAYFGGAERPQIVGLAEHRGDLMRNSKRHSR